MKKSNIILLTFIVFLFLLAFALHTALDNRYRQGIFTRKTENAEQYTTFTLQPYSKVLFRGQSFNKDGNRDCDLTVTYDSTGGNLLKINKVNQASMTWQVSNDTLYINISDPKDVVRCHLSSNRLNYVATNSNMALEQNTPLGKLDIITGAYLYINRLDARELGITLNDNAYCYIEPGGNATQFSLEMRGDATLEADDSKLGFKNTRFSSDSKLLLSGSALQSLNRP